MSGVGTEARAIAMLARHGVVDGFRPGEIEDGIFAVVDPEDVIAAMLAFAADAPPGWVLVPVEPTREMNNAGYQEMQRILCGANMVYAAMLAAAPTPEASVVGNDVVQKSQANRNEAAKEVG